jgi:hypothetical protein
MDFDYSVRKSSEMCPETSCLSTPIMSSEKRTKAVDLSHHVSDYARRYAPSPLKGLQKHHGTKIVLSGGELSNLPPEQY